MQIRLSLRAVARRPRTAGECIPTSKGDEAANRWRECIHFWSRLQVVGYVKNDTVLEVSPVDTGELWRSVVSARTMFDMRA